MKIFEKDYADYEKIRMAYDHADNGEEKDAAGAEYEAWSDRITARGQDYGRFFRSYMDAKNAGNRYIDLHDTISEEQADRLVASFREFGVERFTFSSGWSSAVSIAWQFIQDGCSLEGMVEINSQHTKFLSDEHEKIPAYLFKVGEGKKERGDR